jgi:hypothetical protein
MGVLTRSACNTRNPFGNKEEGTVDKLNSWPLNKVLNLSTKFDNSRTLPGHE